MEKKIDSNPDPEKPIAELEKRITELESFSKKAGVDLSKEIERLKQVSEQQKRNVYNNISAWQRINIARNLERPDATDYIGFIFEDFIELHGDRAFRDDKAIICGLTRLDGRGLMLVAHRKGKTTKERVSCNFGSPHPEGYRKALEKMKLAEKLRIPVVTLVNTPGAYPGIGAEERGQANIIAKNLFEMGKLKTPIISIVIGEGGSGGALAICVADRLLILENAYLSVISPEGCAAILWRDASKSHISAEMLHLTAKDLMKLGIIDEIVPEPYGGAHRNPKETAEIVKRHLIKHLDELCSLSIETLLNNRYNKYRRIGIFVEGNNIYEGASVGKENVREVSDSKA